MGIEIRINLRHAPSVGITFDEASMTQQHFRDECDIDHILKKYSETGFLVDPLAQRRPAKWGDFSSVADYQSAMNKLTSVQEAFDALPSRLRDRFQNDPMQMLAFLEDPENKDEAVKLGLVSVDVKKTESASTPSQASQEKQAAGASAPAPAAGDSSPSA